MTILTRKGGGNLGVPTFPMNATVVTGNDTHIWGVPVMLQVEGAGDVNVVPFGADSASAIVVTVSAAMVANGPYIVPFCVKQLRATSTTVVARMLAIY